LQGFCTKCGAALQDGAKFCTSCGAPIAPAGAAASSAPQAPVAAIVMGAVLVALGGIAAYFALRTNTDVPRAVPGTAGTPGANSRAAADEDGLPNGHPSIELPKEVLDFLDGLTADAEKNPQSIEALQKLAHARYRASVINASYRVSADQALQKLLALDPTNIDGLRISANLAYDAGDYDEARKRFEVFLAKYPDDVSAITDLGSTLLFQDKVDDAIAQYRKALAKDPKFMQAQFNLGVALEKQGKNDEAIASLRKALELSETPDERQHIENTLAAMEHREPMKIAGARSARPGAGAEAAGGSAGGMPAANASGTAPPAQGSMQGGMPMPPPAPDRDVPTNASSDFQRQAEKPFVTHPMIGPRVVSFEWKSATSMAVKIADFPMDKMPPFARAKFESGMAARIGEIASRNTVAGPVTVELIDNASGSVMDRIEAGPPASKQAPPAAAPTGMPGAVTPGPAGSGK